MPSLAPGWSAGTAAGAAAKLGSAAGSGAAAGLLPSPLPPPPPHAIASAASAASRHLPPALRVAGRIRPPGRIPRRAVYRRPALVKQRSRRGRTELDQARFAAPNHHVAKAGLLPALEHDLVAALGQRGRERGGSQIAAPDLHPWRFAAADELDDQQAFVVGDAHVARRIDE